MSVIFFFGFSSGMGFAGFFVVGASGGTFPLDLEGK